MLTNLNIYLNLLSLVALAAVAFYVVRSKIKDENLKDLKERVEILERERDEARVQHVENQKAIANLEGQLSTYKEIPLKQIAESLQELSKSNEKILTVLEGSAIIAATDRDTLLNTSSHVDLQTVDKQIIKEK
jgi:septal ring factor EnvC (AmiA/AmiB activator)